MVVFFLNFLRLYYAVADDEVALTCNLFADHANRQREIEDFWLSRLAQRVGERLDRSRRRLQLA